MSFSTTLTIRLPLELKDQLAALAHATGRSQAFLAVQAMKSYLEQEAWQVTEIQEGLKEADAGDFATEAEVQKFFATWPSDSSH
jgi:RHH-type transcriptional regulator, rel operon repressor / antitoxin RelB